MNGGLPQIATLDEDLAQVRFRLGKLRVGAQGLLELDGGRMHFSLLQQNEPQIVVGFAVFGIEPQCQRVLSGCVVELSERQLHAPQIIVGPDAIRLEADCFPIVSFRLLEIVHVAVQRTPLSPRAGHTPPHDLSGAVRIALFHRGHNLRGIASVPVRGNLK